MNGGYYPAIPSGSARNLRLCCVFALALLMGIRPLIAQQSDAAPYTLHVFTNLMEVPTLVLGLKDQQRQNLDASSFNVSLDSGPKFSPSYVRLEGDDPISLTILLDLSDTSKNVMRALNASIPNLAPTSLHPKDHVTLYTLDCALVRSTEDFPATRENLNSALDATLNSADLHGPKKKASACSNSVRLWDSLAIVTKRLADLPGRRVILFMTSGYDVGSGTHWPDIKRFAASRGIAIFAMDYDSPGPSSYSSEHDNLQQLCNSTGGLLFNTSSEQDMVRNVPHIFDLIRGRYIVQFHRPSNATEGLHNVAITIKHTSATVYLTGTTVPLPSPEELTGPDGLPLNPTTGSFGTRRPLVPH